MLKYIFISSLVLLVSCKIFNDDDGMTKKPVLPPETTTGENTFGFKLEDEIVVVKGTKKAAIFQGGILQIGADIMFSDDDNNYTLLMAVSDPVSTNVKYYFIDIPNHLATISHYTGISLICDYESTNTYEGFIEFTKIDQVNYIVSGRFNLSTAKDECDTIRITDGRFDLQYIP